MTHRPLPRALQIENGNGDTEALVIGNTTVVRAEELARPALCIGTEEQDGPVRVGPLKYYRWIPDSTGQFDTKCIESKPGPGAFLARIVK